MLTLKMDRVEPACVYLQLSLGLLSREIRPTLETARTSAGKLRVGRVGIRAGLRDTFEERSPVVSLARYGS